MLDLSQAPHPAHANLAWDAFENVQGPLISGSKSKAASQHRLGSRWLPTPVGRSAKGRRVVAICCGLAVVTVALADFLTGYELQFSVFYLLPTASATLLVGSRVGIFFSLLAVALSLAGDLASGVDYRNDLALLWNLLITAIFYLVAVFLVTELREFQFGLEDAVTRRTADLQREIAERSRVESMLLDVSEREQRRVGHDLHDTLCQHLTATAIAAQVLSGRLQAADRREYQASVEKLVGMLEAGIDQSRSLARGLAPVELDAEGLMTALADLARTTSDEYGVSCIFQLPQQVLLNESRVTIHLFRIAQEAVRNAVRHGQAKTILIRLTQETTGVRMLVSDNGRGFDTSRPPGDGMGLSIMRYRAGMIPARIDISSSSKGVRVLVETSDQSSTKAPNDLRLNA